MNLLSFVGFYGKEAMAGARELLVARLIDHFSGDIHSVKQVELLEKFLKSKELKSYWFKIIKFVLSE